MGIITNLKQVTIENQDDLSKLHTVAKDAFQAHNLDKGSELKPEEFFNDVGLYCFYEIPPEMDTNIFMQHGAQLRSITGVELLPKPGSVVKSVKVTFTPEQHSDNADQLAHHIHEKEALEDQLKEVKSSFKAKIDVAQANVNQFAKWRSQGYDMQEHKCNVFLDFERKKKVFKAEASGQILHEEEFSHEDFQMQLMLK